MTFLTSEDVMLWKIIFLENMEKSKKKQSEICRLCRKNDENTVSLLDEKGSNGVNFCDMLKFTCNIQISSQDSYPTTACRICVWNLNLSFNFISQCKLSERWFLGSTTGSINTDAPERLKINPETSNETGKINVDSKDETTEAPETPSNNEDQDIAYFEDDNHEDASVSSWNFSQDEANEDSNTTDIARKKATNAKKKKAESQECVCETCGEKFPDEFYFNHHVHLEKNGKKKIAYKCPFCERKYTNRTTLKLHIDVHQGISGNMCEICGKTFYLSGNLKLHMMMHRDERPFECEICHHKFRRQNYLQKHQTTHTGERKFSCEICGKMYASKSILIAHLRIHDNDKRYECEFCQRRFVGKRDMIDHARTHTGETPFKCKYCPRSFSQRNCLRGHMKTHPECKTFDCAICKKKYLKQESLRFHLKIHEDSGKD